MSTGTRSSHVGAVVAEHCRWGWDLLSRTRIANIRNVWSTCTARFRHGLYEPRAHPWRESSQARSVVVNEQGCKVQIEFLTELMT